MEAIKEIIAQMRKPSIYKGKVPVSRVDADFKYFADKLEAAIAQTSQHNNNTAKLREALEETIDTINKWRTGGIMEHWQYSNLYDIADAALSEPPRNCDVGTAKDQAKRFDDFCNSHMYATGYKICGNCPLWSSGTIGKYCEFRWSQMPYESKESEESEVSNDKN